MHRHHVSPHRSTARRQGRGVRRGFTLIELLVVLAIISMLVALLLPALARARGAAQDIKCAAQLKQISTAIMAYALDDKDRLPNHISINANGNLQQFRKHPKHQWGTKSNVSETTGRVYIGAGKILQHHLTDYNILYCPTSQHVSGGSFNLRTTSLGGNTTIKGFAHWKSPVTTHAGNYYSNYLFPAVDVDHTTRTNNGGLWTGISPTLWATSGYFETYSGGNGWKDSMLQPRIHNNLPATPILWDHQDLNNTAHRLRSTNVIYMDGAYISYGATRQVQENSTDSYGALGLSNVHGFTWLRRYRTEGFLPY